MTAYIVDSESGRKIEFSAVDPSVDVGSGTANYTTASLPFVQLQPIYWTGNAPATRSQLLYLEGPDSQAQLENLKALMRPVVDPENPQFHKYSPPVCYLVLGPVVPTRCVVTRVDATIDLRYLDSGLPSRIRVNLNYQEVSLQSIA